VGSESPSSAGLLVVRAWIEHEAEDGLRARITYSLDLRATEQITKVVSSEEEIYAAVRAWLEGFWRR
jgi:hypothetical protein